jgi:hypothetical protein
VNTSEEEQQQEIAFFRDRFQRHPVEIGKFLGWALPKTTVVYEGDPLLTLARLFPVDELFEVLGNRDDEQWLEQERESVQWFLDLMAHGNNRGPEQALPNDEPPPEVMN